MTTATSVTTTPADSWRQPTEPAPGDADPLARWLVRLRLLRANRLVFAAIAAEAISKAIQIQHGLVAKDPDRGPFIGWGDWGAFAANALFSFLVTPALWASYGWIYHAPAKLIAELDARDLFAERAEATRRDGTALGSLSRPWVVAALMVTLLTAVSSWLAAPPAWRPYMLIQLPVWMIGWYMLSIVVARHFNVIRGLERYFGGRSLHVRPLHPDRCGGLGPINAYAHGFALIAADCALGLTLYTVVTMRSQAFGHYAALHFAIGMYLVLSPFCFFATLGTAHRSMQNAKDELLRTISDAFEAVYSDVHHALRHISSSSLEQTEKMERLQALYDTTSRFPVWPLNWESIRRFVIVVLSPLVPVFAEEVAPRMVRLILGH